MNQNDKLLLLHIEMIVIIIGMVYKHVVCVHDEWALD